MSLIFFPHRCGSIYMGVSKNRGTPKSSILIGFSLINHPFWDTPIFGNTHIGHVDLFSNDTSVGLILCRSQAG